MKNFKSYIPKFLFVFLSLSLWTQPAYALFGSLFSDSKCSKLEWTKEDARTQGGAWIWFPGKGIGSNLEEATLRAEGRALEMLSKECAFPHKEVKIHERCNEKEGDDHVVFLRLSLEHKQCAESKNANRKLKTKILNKGLARTLKRYRKLIGDKHDEKKNCVNETAEKCYEYGKHFYYTNEFDSALTLFKTGCQKNHVSSCFNAGVVALRLDKKKDAVSQFKLAKLKGDIQSLFFLGHIEYQDGNTQGALKYYEEACGKDVAKGCLAFATFLAADDEIIKAAKNYEKACALKDGKSCHRASVFFYDQGNMNKAKIMASKACGFDFDKGCYNSATMFKKQKNPKAHENFAKACRLGIGQACVEAGAKKGKEGISLLKSGCEHGHAESCKQASIRLYDSNNSSESIMYSKYACKLGLAKSCHNSGFLEYKQGRLEQARRYLGEACSQGIKQSCHLLSKLD
jgi:TPR repeat protein